MAGSSREHDDDDGTVKADTDAAAASIPAQEPPQARPSVPPPKSRAVAHAPPPRWDDPSAQWKGRLLTLSELQTVKGIHLGRLQISRLGDEGKFPRAIKYSSQRQGWREDQVDAWLMQRAAESETRHQEASERQKRAAETLRQRREASGWLKSHHH